MTPIVGGVRMFYCYSHKDEQLRDRLETHLALLRRQGLISEWHDRRIDGARLSSTLRPNGTAVRRSSAC